jgi:hypothetical protein
MPKLDIFIATSLGCLLLHYVSVGQQQFTVGVKTPSSSGNVYFSNGQTDRTLVPYSSAISTADAVVIHLHRTASVNELPKTRTNHQVKTRTRKCRNICLCFWHAWYCSSSSHLLEVLWFFLVFCFSLLQVFMNRQATSSAFGLTVLICY